MADAVVVNGGSIGPGASYGDSCVFIGVTIMSSCTFGKGCSFVDCAFIKTRRTPRSVVGVGGTMSGGLAWYVDFDATGNWSNVSDNGETTPPSCVDCAIQTTPPVTGAGDYANAQLVTMVGQVSQTDWCAAQRASCAATGLIIEPSGTGFSFAQRGRVINKPQ